LALISPTIGGRSVGIVLMRTKATEFSSLRDGSASLVTTDTQTDGRAVEMGSGSIMYIPSFVKIGSGAQKLLKGAFIV
jgi:hypothetical protein